ncbi:MAG: hypothetical protein KDD70_15860, partial [Bdellovibrionales bacterium]|nr:hypothetical protein [Bdellovibrionales bacterium]
MSVSSRLLKGVSLSSCNQCLVIVQHLWLTPIYLHYWGLQSFGEWMAIYGLTSYLALTNFGIQDYSLSE